jgi:signal peptidase I
MEQDTNEQTGAAPAKPRSGFVAFFLSLLLPGLGQVYNGQPGKAALIFGFILFLPVAFGITRWATSFYGFFSLLLVELALRIYVITDGLRNATRQKEYTPKPYNTWYYHLLIALVMVAVYLVYNISAVMGIKTVIIPTTSNYPTFQLGDRLVADLQAYKNNGPQYGDLVIFTKQDGKMYTYRVVGLPADHLTITGNILTVNERPGYHAIIQETLSDGMPVFEVEEELPNGHRHRMYKRSEPSSSARADLTGIVVPPGCYYLLGDNRDNAADSRYEGFISRDRIKGRIIYSYWGSTTKRINIDFRNK